MLTKLLSAACMIGSTLALPTLAEDRALLIGVGKYQDRAYDLPGIDLDINMMKQAAYLMGFDSVKTLLNEQATLNNVTRTMEEYLVTGVNSNDRLLIYYSGHGSKIPDQNGDEIDAADEVLTMHDMQPVTVNGKKSLSGVLVDDQFNALLTKMPSDNILVLVDACHSGTSTKGMISGILGNNIETHAKAFEYPGMRHSKGNFMPQHKKKEEPTLKYVAISAAGDDEKSIATAKGSLFTLGILKTIQQAAKKNIKLSAKDLKAESAKFITAENKRDSPFSPRLSGNLELASKAIQIRASNNGYGEVWKRLVSLTQKADTLDIRINQTDYADRDNLIITINNQKSGYLNVINVGPKDKPTVLFPNQFNPHARIEKTVTIPTDEMNFNLPAQKPFGESLIIAFLSQQPLNLYNSGDATRNKQDKIDRLFHTLSALGLEDLSRSFAVAAKTDAIRAGHVITRVCPSTCK